MSTERTAWHPPFTTAMRERGPRWVRVSGEVQLTQEPMRADDVFELRVEVARDPNDCGSVLRGLWPLLVWVCLLEFKSISRPFRRGDLGRLLAYGYVWFYSHQSKEAVTTAEGVCRRAKPGDLTLALAVPRLTRTLLHEAATLNLTLERFATGYHRLRGGSFALVVIELARVASTEHDELMGWFAGTTQSPSLDLTQWIGQNTSAMSTPDKASPDQIGFNDWMDRLRPLLKLDEVLAGLDPEEVLGHYKPEERVAGLDPEQRLAGLDPEQRLAGLDPEHVVLALPDVVLRALPESYLATLPEAAQQRIRARLGR